MNAGKNTPGIDKLVLKTPAARGKMVDALAHTSPWRAKPVRRIYIPKAKNKMRPLGIPVMMDRCLQALVKNALEPAWEARFEGSSYGFRPGRSGQDAIGKIYGLACPNRNKKWILDADIKGAFEQFCTKEQSIVFAGGCAQNAVCNDKLTRMYPRLVIPPHCSDAGISLGCLEFLRLHYQQPQFCRDLFPFWQSDEDGGQACEKTIQKTLDLLLDGKIVGWFQGNGEVGPRALGHRSILMDPRVKDAKQVLNSRVKHREHWRPYAPSVLQSKASEWFDIDEPCPYMLRAVSVREEQKALVPAIVHQDNTSRIQTVPDDGGHGLASYAQLLSDFYKRTGVPMLLNTSLNAGGSPIFGRREQSIKFFEEVDMDALCIGDELLVK